MNQALLREGGRLKGGAWGMKEGTEEQETRGNGGGARRLKQHCTAGCRLLLHHLSITITDKALQRITFDNQYLSRDVLNLDFIFPKMR